MNCPGSIPQIHQVQHIAHVQNLQQFSPFHPVNPVPHIQSSNFYKQTQEKSATATQAEEKPKEAAKDEKPEATTKSTSPIIEALTPKTKPTESKEKKPEPAKQ